MPSWRPCLKLAVCASVCAMILGGCGGGGTGSQNNGGGAASAHAATGKIILPAGFKLPTSRLAVATEAGQAAVAPNGSFAVPVSSSGPRVAQLIDTTTNKIVLLGFVDSSSSGSMFAGGKSQISPLTTASALLFLGLSGPNLPAPSWESFLESIMSSAQAAGLAKTVANSVGGDPTAISDGDSAVARGVENVQATAQTPSALVVTHDSSKAISSVRVTETQTARGNLISVNPDTVQSGVEIEPNPKGDGIVVVNHLRRRAELFAYEVAAGDTPKSVKPLPQPLPFISGEEIEPEEALDGVYTTLLIGLEGKVPYTPVTTGPFGLEADKGSPVTVYELVVVGTGLTNNAASVAKDVAPKDPATQAQIASQWVAASTKLYMETFVKDVVIPVAIWLTLDAKIGSSAPESAELEASIEKLTGTLSNVGTALAARNLRLAASTFFKDLTTTPSAKTALIEVLKNYAIGKGIFSPGSFESLASRLEAADTAMVVINTCFLSVDLTRLFQDSTIYNLADDWVATVLQPKITLSPNPSTVNEFQNIAILSTTVQNVSDLSGLRFKWSTSGDYGSLEEPNSSIPMPAGITSFSQVAYVASIPKLKSGNSDTVSVTVYASTDLSTPIGTASALVKAQPGTENGSFLIDSADDFTGLVKNDPWVLSAVATCPFVPGVQTYLVEASGPTTGNYTYYVSTANGFLEVLDAEKKPYVHYLADSKGVKIAIAGDDSANAAVPGAAALLLKEYPISKVFITFE